MSAAAHAVLIGVAFSVGIVAAGALALRFLRSRALTLSILVIALVPLVALVGGVVVASGFMFTEELQRSAYVWAAVVLISVPSAVLLGRSIARQSVWEREALDRERAAERSRRELLAWLSHDLRTPIAGVQAMTEALEDGVVSDPGDVADYAQMIRSETFRLAGMIDDLFEMSQIHAGTLTLRLEPLEVGEVVRAAVAASRPIADRRGVDLLVEVPDPGPLAVAAAPELMRVLRNLLSNAIRHTPPGEVVRVHVGADGGATWLRVDDSCGGIAAEDLPQVFDLGYRGSKARESDHRSGTQGAGMGLAIARGLLDAQAATIDVVNRSGGCRFEVRLPAPA